MMTTTDYAFMATAFSIIDRLSRTDSVVLRRSGAESHA